jgi:hypothetical protein
MYVKNMKKKWTLGFIRVNINMQGPEILKIE